MAPEVRLCKKSEVGELMRFVAAHWSADHVLATHRELLLWQHARGDELLNFVIGRTERGIEGVLGFISSGSLEPFDGDDPVLWLALWKVREDCSSPMLGLLLYRYLIQNESFSGLGCVGFNETTKKLLSGMGYTTGVLGHYYLLNRQVWPTVLLAGVARQSPDVGVVAQGERKQVKFTCLLANDIDAACQALASVARTVLPRRSAGWYAERYLEHPVYRYEILGLTAGSDIVGLLVLRQVGARGALALRIVDFCGDETALQYAGDAFQSLLVERDAEYIDFLNMGMTGEYLFKCGFRLRSDGDGVVVPQYFEPFVAENRDIHYALKSSSDAGWRIFKGDGDQDRPNIIA